MLKFLLVTETFPTSDISRVMSFNNASHFPFESHHNAAAQIKPTSGQFRGLHLFNLNQANSNKDAWSEFESWGLIKDDTDKAPKINSNLNIPHDAWMCICLGCRTDFGVCLRDVQETRLCVYEGCGADYSSSDFQLNYIFETSPPLRLCRQRRNAIDCFLSGIKRHWPAGA